MLPSFATQTVTRLRAPLVDDGHNNAVPNWSAATSTPITGCSVQPGSTDEVLENRDTTLIQWTVYAPSTADVLSSDRISYLGVEYEIDGQPAAWPSPSGALDHKVLLLKRWNG